MIEVAHVPQNNTFDNRWMDTGFLDYSGSWLNDTDFILDVDGIDKTTYETLSVSYVTVTGEFKTFTATADPDSPVKIGMQNVYRNENSSFKGRGTTASVKYYDFEYKGKSYKLPNNDYYPAGVMDDNLVTLFRPRGVNPFLEPDKFEEVEGGTEQEKLDAMLDLLYPKGQDALQLSDAQGKINKEIDIPSDAWVSEDAVVNEKDNYVLIFQQDRAIPSTKSRYLKVTLDGTIDVIYEGLPIDSLDSNKTILSPDMNSILVSVGPNSYSFVDIDSKEVTKFCDECADVKISNPWLFRIGY